MTRITILLVLLVLVVAGCASGEGAASDEAPEPTATAEATPEPTEESEEPTEVPEPSLSEGAGDLADVLPDEVGGIAIEYQHSSGQDVLGAEGVDPEAQAFFDRVGADPSDLTSAFGFAFDQESATAVSIVAFRVDGADEGQLRTEFLATMAESGDAVGEEQTVEGKTVHAFGSDLESPDGYLYVKDDTIFLIGGEPASIVEEALAALP